MRKNLILLLITFNLSIITGNAQTVTKKDVVKIAKRDSLMAIKKIKHIVLLTDSMSGKLVWIVSEKINLGREQIKVETKGMVVIYSKQLTIDSETGVILFRKNIKEGSVHTAPDF